MRSRGIAAKREDELLPSRTTSVTTQLTCDRKIDILIFSGYFRTEFQLQRHLYCTKSANAENKRGMNDKLRSRERAAPSLYAFRRAVLRGLGVVMPLLLTIVFLLWVWNSVQTFVLMPMKNAVRSVAVSQTRDVHYEIPLGAHFVELHRNNKDKKITWVAAEGEHPDSQRILDVPCLLYTSPSPRDKRQSRMPSSA